MSLTPQAPHIVDEAALTPMGVKAGAPAREAVIQRMTDRLFSWVSIETGNLDIAGPDEARRFILDLLAAGEEAPS